MSSTTFILLLISVVLLSTPPAATADSPTVYEVLESYNFPVGLLPIGVTSYELDPTSGRFSVYLNRTCSFAIDGYDLRYQSTITGTISTYRIMNLRGIQVRILFFWLNIIELTRDDDDEIEFSVGIASASFPVDSFYESPQCGCGFDYVNIAVVAGKKSRKIRFKMGVPFRSSIIN